MGHVLMTSHRIMQCLDSSLLELNSRMEYTFLHVLMLYNRVLACINSYYNIIYFNGDRDTSIDRFNYLSLQSSGLSRTLHQTWFSEPHNMLIVVGLDSIWPLGSEYQQSS